MKRFLLGNSHTEIALGLNNVAMALAGPEEIQRGGGMYRERSPCNASYSATTIQTWRSR